LNVTPENRAWRDEGAVGGSEGMMIQQTSQDRLILDRLSFKPRSVRGKSLIVRPTAEIKGLGEYFFSSTSAAPVRASAGG